MPRGGSRPNAGRKKGSATKRSGAVKVEAVRNGITPAEVMQKAMEVHYKAKRYDKAASVARDLAPYVHPRLSSVQHDGKMRMIRSTEDLSDEELQALAGDGTVGTGPSAASP